MKTATQLLLAKVLGHRGPHGVSHAIGGMAYCDRFGFGVCLWHIKRLHWFGRVCAMDTDQRIEEADTRITRLREFVENVKGGILGAAEGLVDVLSGQLMRLCRKQRIKFPVREWTRSERTYLVKQKGGFSACKGDVCGRLRRTMGTPRQNALDYITGRMVSMGISMDGLAERVGHLQHALCSHEDALSLLYAKSGYRYARNIPSFYGYDPSKWGRDAALTERLDRANLDTYNMMGVFERLSADIIEVTRMCLIQEACISAMRSWGAPRPRAAEVYRHAAQESDSDSATLLDLRRDLSRCFSGGQVRGAWPYPLGTSFGAWRQPYDRMSGR